MAGNALIFTSVYIALLFGIPLILSLNAMGRRVRADYESGDAKRIASNVGLQRTLTVRTGAIAIVALVFGHWMITLTVLLMGAALLLPFWLNPPRQATDDLPGD